MSGADSTTEVTATGRYQVRSLVMDKGIFCGPQSFMTIYER